MKETKKLYKVTLKGMTYSSSGISYGVSYVVAKDSNEAYMKVKEYLDRKDIGFRRERELNKVELIAEDAEYTDTGYILYS